MEQVHNVECINEKRYITQIHGTSEGSTQTLARLRTSATQTYELDVISV